MNRKVGFALAILLGLTVGLIYGWLINPATYSDTTPDTLRADYPTDYVLMVAETYQMDGDAGLAARRLALFGAKSPVDFAVDALTSAQGYGYADTDMRTMANLITALRVYTPAPAATAVPEVTPSP